MKKNKKAWIPAFAGMTRAMAAFALLAFPAFGAFENVGTGARPGAMGDAFTAVPNDVHAIYFNPGSLATLTSPEFASMYSRLFMGLSDNSDIGVSQLAYGQPLGKEGRWGRMGLGLWRLKLDSLFTEQSLQGAYSRDLRELWGGRLYGGAGLKWLTRSYGSTLETANAINLSGASLGSPDPVFANGNSKSAMALDLGALYRMRSIYTIGLALQNVNQPGLALSSSDKDVVPMTLRLGVSAAFLRTRFALDVVQRASIPGQLDNNIHRGVERWWRTGGWDTLSLRAGLVIGSRDLRKFSIGLGYEFSRIAFHYGFHLPLGTVKQTDGSHQLSLNFRFGSRSAEDEDLESALLREEQKARIRAESDLQEALAAHKKAVAKLDSVMAELEKMRRGGAPVTGTAQDEMERQRLSAEEEARHAKEREEQARKQLESTYRLSLSYYERRVKTGAGIADRIGLLEKIVSKYGNSVVDIQEVSNELTKLRQQQAEAVRELGTSWGYYQQLANQGVSKETRIEVLHRILKKFEGKGVDLAPVQQELKNLGEK